MGKVKEAYSPSERAVILLADLEKLKTKVSSIEARYDILKHEYTKICEDAILKISAIKADLNGKTEEAEFKNLEARFKLGLVPAETYLTQKDFLAEGVSPSHGGLQFSVDKVANCIEFGLDKIGDGIIFPIEKTVNIFVAIFRFVKRKVAKQR